ncbi:MAG: sensor histidine kinase [Marinifilaceae bacterium]
MISHYELSQFISRPKIKNRIRMGFHVLFLLGFAFVYVPAFEIEWPLEFPRFFYRDVFEYGVLTLFVYILYFAGAKETYRHRIPLLAGLIAVMLTLMSILAYYKNLQPHLDHTSFVFIFDDVLQYIGYGTVLFLLFLFFDHIDFFFSSKYYKMKEALEATRNQLLRQQFHPHFLFNALNSVYSMSLNQHPQTPDTILKLSGMMRYITDEVNVKRIPLDREVKFLEEYMAIEKIRFGKNADIHLEIEGETRGKLIEPLLLIPLVENAFKHGFYTNNPSSFVHIRLKLEDETLKFSIRNSIQANKPSGTGKREGKGLKNLKKRLALSYPKTSKLLLSEQENVYLAKLELKLEA